LFLWGRNRRHLELQQRDGFALHGRRVLVGNATVEIMPPIRVPRPRRPPCGIFGPANSGEIMPLENEHLEKLRGARTQTVGGRREIAARLAEAYEEGQTEELREWFVEIQATIEAIDRAILDEEKLAHRTDIPIPPG
jgi:hypothetical protein